MSNQNVKCIGLKNDGTRCNYNSNTRYGSGTYCKKHWFKYDSTLRNEITNSQISLEFLLDNDQKCSICLEDIKYDENLSISQTPCAHIFHLKCAKNWIEKNETCPICRFKLDMNDVFLIKKPNLELIKNLHNRFNEIIKKNESDFDNLTILRDILEALS